MKRADINLRARALAEHWPISQAQRKRIIKELLDIVTGDQPTRSKISAVKALAPFTSMNYEGLRLLLAEEAAELQEEMTHGQHPHPGGPGADPPPVPPAPPASAADAPAPEDLPH